MKIMEFMKKKIILLLPITFMLFSSLTVAAEDEKKIYDKKCASCHGKDGKGNAAMIKMLKADASLLDLQDKATLDKSDEELISIIFKGVNKMPAYKGKISDKIIAEIAAYIKTLK